MRYVTNIFLALIFLISGIAVSQDNKIKKGNKEYQQYAFIDAQQAYLKVVENGFSSADILQKLGDSYYFTAEYSNAVKWYEALYNEYADSIEPDYLYRYAQSLKSTKNYKISDKIMDEFYQKNGSDNRAQFFDRERDYLKEIDKIERFDIEPGSFNTKLSDFAPAFYQDQLIFATNGRDLNRGTRIHDWNEQPFLDLYKVDLTSDGKTKNIEPFSSKLNTKFHESTAVFSKDGKTVYFTRNNFTRGSYKKDSKGTNRLKLYRAVQNENSKWKVDELPFNNNEYSVAHPALSPDEKTLYFASDMPGGKGYSDLYKVDITDEGFGEPVSLGDAINTKERETFPFISADNKLYFASDGHVGLGGLDVFVTEIDDESGFGGVYNLGKPINSSVDDFTFIIDVETEYGYFASNRNGGKGDDDIYRFKRLDPLDTSCAQTLEGFIRDDKSKEAISEAKVILLNEDNVVVAEVISKANGSFSFELECGQPYSVRSSKDKYSTEEKSFGSTYENNAVLDRTLFLKKGKDLTVSPIEVGSDLAKILNLNPIHFDLDRFNIRQDAAIELQKVIAVLREYPSMEIDVRSHTDSRGRDSYNKILSDRRAQSTIDYLISDGGINRARLTGRGYGESELVNHCANGVKCADYVHEENRRSEFIVLKN